MSRQRPLLSLSGLEPFLEKLFANVNEKFNG